MNREIKYQFVFDSKHVTRSYTLEELIGLECGEETIFENEEVCNCELTESVNHCEGGCMRFHNSVITHKRQYTGLKDKNGKEIYEGDILKVHMFTRELGSGLGVMEGEREFIAEVCFQEMGLWLQGDTEENSGYILWFDGLHEESFEVIGNIYENPDLIK